MDHDLVNQIWHKFKYKDTEELLKIYTTYNLEKWSEEAFEAIRILLRQRNIEIPKITAELEEYPQGGDDSNKRRSHNDNTSIFYELVFMPLKLGAAWLIGWYVFSWLFLQLIVFFDRLTNNDISSFIKKLFFSGRLELPPGKNPLILPSKMLGLAAALWLSFFIFGKIEKKIRFGIQVKRAGNNTEALKQVFDKKDTETLIKLLRKHKKKKNEKNTQIIQEIIDERNIAKQVIENFIKERNPEMEKIFKKNITASNIAVTVGGFLMIIGLLSPWVSNFIISISGMNSDLISKYLIYPAILICVLGSSGIFLEKSSLQFAVNRTAMAITGLSAIYLMFLFFYINLNLNKSGKKIFIFNLGPGFWICVLGVVVILVGFYFVEKQPLK